MPSEDRAGTNEGDVYCEGVSDVDKTGCRKMPLRSLIRMRREVPVRFLGGGSAAMRCGYPTPLLLQLLPVGTKITGRDSHPLEDSALARRTLTIS